jgi:hypothetical protein
MKLNMLIELQKKLGPVRSRLKLHRRAAALATGLMLGGWLAVVAGLMALLGRSYWAGVAGIAALVTVPLALWLRAMLQPTTWNDAARAIDAHFQLNDRTTTAMYLAAHPSGDPFEALQLDDASQHIAQLPLRQAVSVAIPWQRLLSGLVLSGFALALIGASIFLPALRSLRGSRPVVVEHGADLIERKNIETPVIDEAATLRSAALMRTTAQRLSVDDVAGRYFDRLNAPPPRKPTPARERN